MNKIIFMSGIPISRIQGDQLNPYWFVDNGIDVEYWDMTKLHYSKKALDIYFGGHPDYRYKFPTEKIFTNIEDVIKEIKNNSTNALFNYIDFYAKHNYELLRNLRKYKAKYYVGPRRATFLSERMTRSVMKKVFDMLLDTNFANKVFGFKDGYLINKTRNIIYDNTSYYQKPCFVISSGAQGRVEWMNATKADSFVSIKSPEICWEELPNLIEESYCVYVDESVAYSPDRGLWDETTNNTPSSDFNSFVKNMCCVFDLIEKVTGVKVVIAASGKYEYPDEGLYGGRKMIYRKTQQLIQSSEFVLGHTSSGMFQALVSMKPIILLRDPTFSKYKDNGISQLSKFLNIEAILTTGFSSSHLDNLSCDKEYYNDIIEKYFREKDVIDNYYLFVKQYLESI